MFGQPFRLDPVGKPQDYQTFQLQQDINFVDRKVPATCEEVDCANYKLGWKTILPVGSDLLQVARKSGRKYTEAQEESLVTFTFAPGQPCFVTHWKQNERPFLFVMKDGDYRASQNARVVDPSEWVDRFATRVDDIREQIKEG